MKTIALAIGKTDTGTPSLGHFGDSDCFAKFVLHTNGRLIEECEVQNQSKEIDETHGAKKKMKSVLAELGSIHCVVSGQMSPNFKRMALQSAIQPVVVRFSDETQLRDCLCAERQILFDLVARRQNGERSSEIPILKATDTLRSKSKSERKQK